MFFVYLLVPKIVMSMPIYSAFHAEAEQHICAVSGKLCVELKETLGKSCELDGILVLNPQFMSFCE